jgi:hypothetical protein
MTTTTTTATTEAVKPDSLVVTLHKNWVTAGSKKADEKAIKKAIADYKALTAKREAAEAAFKAAASAESDAVAAIVKMRGKGRLMIDGVLHTPMSRGETVYFRKDGEDAEAY